MGTRVPKAERGEVMEWLVSAVREVTACATSWAVTSSEYAIGLKVEPSPSHSGASEGDRIQVADLVLENISAPDWVMQTILLVLALGFPVVVFFSWAYEVTPEGIKREAEVDRSQSITHVTGRKLDRAIFVVLLISLGYFIWESRFADRTGSAMPGTPSPRTTTTTAWVTSATTTRTGTR